MAKIMSETERRLQKKLIPLNIFVCILALVAAISLFLAPLIKLDVGKILSSEVVMEFAEEKLEDMINESGEVPEGEVDVTPVVAAVVKNVMSNAEGAVTFDTVTLLKAVFAAKGTRGDALKEKIFYDGLVDRLIDSVADGVANMFDTPEGKTLIEETMVKTITTQLVTNLPDGVTVNEDKLSDLTKTLLEIDGKDRDGAQEVVNSFVNKMDGLFGEDFDIEGSKENISEYIMDLYDDTVAELEDKGQTFSVEAMICVTVSKNTDLGNFNLGELIKGILPEGSGESPSKAVGYALTEGETEGEPPAEDETPVEPPLEEKPQPDDSVICTTYPELMEAMGLGDEDVEELKENLKTSLRAMVDDYVAEYTKYVDKYWYALFAPLVFIIPWIILFLFSFFHMFAKNKRFTMWYVKLLGWLPCLVFGIVPLVAPKVLPLIPIEVITTLMTEYEPLVRAVFSGISSLTWISGGCYVLLWLFSIFWAFPIKRKIRKEREFCKQAMQKGAYPYDDYAAYGDAGKGKKRGKKNKRGDGYAPDAYGTGYGYGDGYGPDLGGGYGSPYGGYDDGGFDDDYDYDSFGYPPYDSYGSSYGSIYDDDDDDY